MKIKILFAILTTVFAGTFALRVLAASVKQAAPDSAQLLRQAEARYESITRNLARYRLVKRTLRKSGKGGDLGAYFEGKTPRYLVANYRTKTGEVREDYAFYGSRMFFARRVVHGSATVIFTGPQRKAENHGYISGYRFYFSNGKIFLYLLEEIGWRKAPSSLALNGSDKRALAAAAKIKVRARQLLKIAQSPPRAE